MRDTDLIMLLAGFIVGILLVMMSALAYCYFRPHDKFGDALWEALEVVVVINLIISCLVLAALFLFF